MWDLAPHDLSIFNFILNQDPIKVSAIGGVYINKSAGLPEVVYLTLQYGNGVIAHLQVSWLDPIKTRRITVVGSKKMLVFDDLNEPKVVLFDKGVEMTPNQATEAVLRTSPAEWAGPERRSKSRRTAEEFHASYRNGSQEIVPVEWTEPLKAECAHFIACIRSGCEPCSDGRSGLKVLRILEAAQRSLMNGGLELAIEY